MKSRLIGWQSSNRNIVIVGDGIGEIAVVQQAVVLSATKAFSRRFRMR
jgi:hypothetical protein